MSTQTPRVMIVGSSETGKTTLAKNIAKATSQRGLAVTVYDPVLSEWSGFVTDNASDFFAEIKCSYEDGARQAVFIDEADTIMGINDKGNHWLLTRGRHFAIMPYIITQRPALVAPTVRNQCNQLFCFQVSRADAKLLADDFAHDGLLSAPELLQGEFLRCHWRDKKKIVDKGRIF